MPCEGIHALASGPIEFPELVYSYVVCDEKVVMIDAGVSNTVMDVSFLDRLDYLVITHVHLDHVGGLSELVQRYKPKVFVYKGYSKYLRDTKQLNESARQVLGDLVDIYGEVEGVDADFVEVSGGEEVDLGRQKMKIIYTPGHAKHHISVLIGDVLYSGDSAGGRYNGVPIPTTPPPFDYWKYLDSLKLQISLRPRMVGLSHGGLVPGSHLEEHYNQMVERKYRVSVDIGGIQGEIIRKHLEINYRGIEESLAKEKQ